MKNKMCNAKENMIRKTMIDWRIEIGKERN
jgi:hypothetical protein